MNNIIETLIKEAEKSIKSNDVPVAAIITENGEIISKAHNCREKYQSVTKHAEIIALEKACNKKKSWHLDDCEIYITMEPCLMCMNAISQARIKKIHYILENKKYVEIQSKMNNKLIKNKIEISNKKIDILLKNFFKDKRNKQ